MNPTDPAEHFSLCSECGELIIGYGDCRHCPVETVQIPGFLIFGVLAILGVIVLANVVILIGWLDWFHYVPDFWTKLKGE